MGSWNLSLRTDRPIQGCEVTALAYLYQKSLKKKNGVAIEVPQPPPPPPNEYEMRFRWLQGPPAPTCANDQCPVSDSFCPLVWSSYARKGGYSLQCVDQRMVQRMALAKPPVFCGPDCLRAMWGHALRNPSNRAASEPPNGVHAKPLTNNGEDYLIAPRPRSDSVADDSNEWVEVAQGRVYRPTRADVGRRFRLECTAVKHDGTTVFGPKSIRLEPVLAAPPSVPKRPISSLKGASNGATGPRMRVVSYNILAEIYATRHMYPYCDMWALAWSYRCQNILREIKEAAADVVCLQEVQADYYESDLKPMLAEMGFDGMFKAKTRTSLGTAGKVDGCAILWRKNKFRLAEHYGIEFNELARTFADAVATSEDHSREILSRLNRGHIALCCVLEYIPRNGARSNGSSTFCVANTHLYSNKDYPDVKLWQCLKLLHELEHIILGRDLPLILCGDFNSIPTSAVHELLCHRGVSDGHPDLKEDVARILPPVHEMTHNLPLTSAYQRATGSEPRFTNFTQQFVGTLDYIFFTAPHIRLLSIVDFPEPEQLQRVGLALPNVQYSSDHLLLSADFLLVDPSAPPSYRKGRRS